jgi:hypothetical protein
MSASEILDFHGDENVKCGFLGLREYLPENGASRSF